MSRPLVLVASFAAETSARLTLHAPRIQGDGAGRRPEGHLLETGEAGFPEALEPQWIAAIEAATD